MLIIPPRIFFDTQIINDAERGTIASHDWHHVVSYIKQTARYCISPLTVAEILAGLAKGDSKFFTKHQQRLRLLLAPDAQAEVFDFMRYFVSKELGLNIQRPAHLEDDFLGVIGLVLAAPSKEALLNGFPHPTNSQQVKIRLDRFIEENEQIKKSYIHLLRQLKGRSKYAISLEDWVSNLLVYCEVVNVSNSIKEEIAQKLSAAYQFEVATLNLARNTNFDVARNISDQVDGQQLWYLCASNTVFVTNDSDFKNRTQGSPQAKRIKTFGELLECAKEKLPL